MIGVMPEPAASSNSSSSSESGVNVPAGPAISRMSPARTLSQIQFDTCPPGTRLTVTVGAASIPGALDSE
jgi:hypothetical protein